jgi:hypothetical protein
MLNKIEQVLIKGALSLIHSMIGFLNIEQAWSLDVPAVSLVCLHQDICVLNKWAALPNSKARCHGC